MRVIICLLVALFLPLVGPVPSWSGSPAACHCFRNRDYDPDNRFAADEYLLTTSLNSLTALYFGIAKKEIVMAKMGGGTDGDDLLVALYLARLTGRPLKVLLSIRDNGGAWPDILASADPESRHADDPVAAAVSNGVPAPVLGEKIVRIMLTAHYPVSAGQLAQLEQQGFSVREQVLLVVLSHLTGRTVTDLAQSVRNRGMSWSELAHRFRFSPAGLGRAILEGSGKTAA